MLEDAACAEAKLTGFRVAASVGAVEIAVLVASVGGRKPSANQCLDTVMFHVLWKISPKAPMPAGGSRRMCSS